MTAGGWVLAGWAAATCAIWCALAIRGLRASLRFRSFDELRADPPASWPRLSVVVPACDEAETLGPALASLLTQDYPDLEIVVVDDRSRDATGRIADEAAARDRRVRVVHVSELPKGWLGKVNALELGLRASSGTWVLFTDADVHFAPGALSRAVAYVEARGLDHLAVAPELHAQSLAQEIVSAAFASAYMLGTHAIDVDRPGSKGFAGVGAFNLVRRAAFDRTPGFSWLRLEVLDDVGVGLMLKNAGGRSAFAIGLGSVTITWYRSLAEMARGLEKNMFGAFCRYRLTRLAGFVLAAAAILPGPIVALAIGPRPWLPLAALVVAALVVVNALVLAVRTRRPIVVYLLAPAGGAVLAALVVRSAWRCIRDGGVTWRGTFYPIAELKAGQRVKL